jgi:hypothetical protein
MVFDGLGGGGILDCGGAPPFPFFFFFFFASPFNPPFGKGLPNRRSKISCSSTGLKFLPLR